MAQKRIFGIKNDLGLGINAIKVLQRRYLLQNEKGEVLETPSQLFRRVARAVASVETKYGQKGDVKKIEDEFYKAMSRLEFLPNTPTLMNAGTKVGQLSACFVIPVGDSLPEIFEAVKWTAIIHQSGGGTGFNFSHLRPQGDSVKSTGGIASGPVRFMTIFDKTTEVIKQGGKRRGANMGILRVDHPDIMEFIVCKSKEGFLSNFNISVAVTDAFMKAVKRNSEYSLVNPRNKQVVGRLNARKVFDLIITNAWKTGDPGIIFIDKINRSNPTPGLGEIEATNPCGEQPLLSWESCNLGSINLSKVVKNNKINWKKLARLVQLGVRFLDDVIDANKYPAPQIERITLANRKIGIGVMGFADALIQMNIPYNSRKALAMGEKIMRFIQLEGRKTSQRLGKERGNFPNFDQSVWRKKYRNLRNATVTTVAPTGTISIISGCSSGIEPLFAVSYVRNVMEGTRLQETNHYFEKIARKMGFYSSDLLHEILGNGSVQNINKVPKNIKKIFVTALDIQPEFHIKMQSAFQKYTDNAVSKTVNLPQTATPEDVRGAYLLAYRLNSKGVTVYRYNSKPDQVLTIEIQDKVSNKRQIVADSEFGGGCEGIVCPH
ncbi:MAG: adenosylcobalamin-dependent ribonucleoside-diphosphate reductase [Thaumarchaeota archaeon]|nr:adenosylcobalamin-dependent ribonucleoside-diphosphate reductase [Nitrososphaerota archaeon]